MSGKNPHQCSIIKLFTHFGMVIKICIPGCDRQFKIPTIGRGEGGGGNIQKIALNILCIFVISGGSMLISGGCVFFIAILKTQTQSLIMSCLFGGISVIGWNALDVIGMEVFPTHLRYIFNYLLHNLSK